jgi:hypothetical protein
MFRCQAHTLLYNTLAIHPILEMPNGSISAAIFFRLQRNVSCEIRLSKCQVEHRHDRNIGMLIESEIILKLVIGIGVVMALSELFKTTDVDS